MLLEKVRRKQYVGDLAVDTSLCCYVHRGDTLQQAGPSVAHRVSARQMHQR
jgi:hypothetical protein